MRYLVAIRYKLALLDLKQSLGKFIQTKRIIETALKNGDIETAKLLFKEMGRELVPLAGVLEGVKIQRPEEQRKLRNVKQWLSWIARKFDPKYMEKYLSENPEHAIPFSLERIEDTLKSLSRVQDRLEGYTKLEKEFRHGPYKIINKYGYTSEEYNAPLKLLDEASEAVKKAGFGSVVYGDVHLVSVKGAGFAGRYHSQGDYIELNVFIGKDIFPADSSTMIHELGHRYWHKKLSDAQREAYTEAYLSGVDVLTLEDRKDMFQALVKTNFSVRDAVRHLKDPKLASLFLAYCREFKGNFLPFKEWAKAYAKEETWVYNSFVHPKFRIWRLEKGRQPVTVSDYAKGKVGEDYAETFRWYVHGWRIPAEVVKRFVPTMEL